MVKVSSFPMRGRVCDTPFLFQIPSSSSVCSMATSSVHRDVTYWDEGKAALWWRVDRVVSVVLWFLDPLDGFYVRRCCRLWREVIAERGPSFYKTLYFRFRLGSELSMKLCSRSHPRYFELRRGFHFNSLRPDSFIPNIIVANSHQKALVWVTDVPMTTLVSEFCQAVGLAEGDICFANGLKLSPQMSFGQHLWPARKGRRGWTSDLCVLTPNRTLEEKPLEAVVPVLFSSLVSQC